MKKGKVEEWVYEKLTEDAICKNQFDEFVASINDGKILINLTYFIADYVQEYSDQQNAELLEKIEQLKSEQQTLVERINQLTPFKKEGI